MKNNVGGSNEQGGESMNTFEETVSYRFAAFCVKVLKLSARKCYEEIGRRNEERNVTFFPV